LKRLSPEDQQQLLRLVEEKQLKPAEGLKLAGLMYRDSNVSATDKEKIEVAAMLCRGDADALNWLDAIFSEESLENVSGWIE
jgi:hypothetical protein